MLTNKGIITIDNRNDDASISESLLDDNSININISNSNDNVNNEHSRLRPRRSNNNNNTNNTNNNNNSGGGGGGHPINILRTNPNGGGGTVSSNNNNPDTASLYGSIMTSNDNGNDNDNYNYNYNYNYNDNNGALNGNAPPPQTVVDYETLLTMALENTSRRAEVENKKKQNILLALITLLFIMSLCIICTVTYSQYSYPHEEQELHNEINNLESDIDELHGEVNNFTQDEDIDLLTKEIDDKRVFIDTLEHDETIDPKERETLVKAIQNEIDDLKVAVQELEKNDITNNNNATATATDGKGEGEGEGAVFEPIGESTNTDNGTI